MADGVIKPDVLPIVNALARGDFFDLSARFSAAGYVVGTPAPGILQVTSPVQARAKLAISVGVHGDETGPIEMLARLLDGIAGAPAQQSADTSRDPAAGLGVDLLVVVGNPAAIASGKRYLEADLNRQFKKGTVASCGTAEAVRAHAIMEATDAFFVAPSNGGAIEKWHLDLHAAIRTSVYSTFAIVPDIATGATGPLLGWLAEAQVGAVVFNSTLAAATYSAYTASCCGATSCTAEIGRIATFGENDLTPFSAMAGALHRLLREGPGSVFSTNCPDTYIAAREVTKRSDRFVLHVDRSTPNFTAFAPGTLIAEDGDARYIVGPLTEYVLFPNSNVAIGQRAGLMVVKPSDSSALARD